jgi:hypothetical protein
MLVEAASTGGERERQRHQQGALDLDRGGAADGVRRGRQQRVADALWLDEAPLGQPGGRSQRGAVPRTPGAGGVLVAQVDVAVLGDRRRGHQPVRFGRGVPFPGGRPQAERRRVRGEQHDEDRQRSAHGRQSRRTAAVAGSAQRLMSLRAASP